MRYLFRKRKNQQEKKLKTRNLTKITLQHVKSSTKNVVYGKKDTGKKINAFFTNQKSYEKFDIEQNATEREQGISLSCKEHIIFVGIGIVFSIILYLISFLV